MIESTRQLIALCRNTALPLMLVMSGTSWVGTAEANPITPPSIEMTVGFSLSVADPRTGGGFPSGVVLTVVDQSGSAFTDTTGSGRANVATGFNGYSCPFACPGGALSPFIRGNAWTISGGTATVSALLDFDLIIQIREPTPALPSELLLRVGWLQPGTIGHAFDPVNDTVSARWSFAIGSAGPSPVGIVSYFDSCNAPTDLSPFFPDYPGCDGIYPNMPDFSESGLLVPLDGDRATVNVRLALDLSAVREGPVEVPAAPSLMLLLGSVAGLLLQARRRA